jgi:hypothetical protein
MRIITSAALCIISLFLLPNLSFCQASGNYKADSVDLTHIREIKVKLDTNSYQKVTPVIFNNISVRDVRYDTTQIGIYAEIKNPFNSYLITNYKIDLEDGLAQSFGTFLNNSFKRPDGNSDMEVVCFIKRLSISRRDTLVENNSLYKKYGKLNFDVEVFLRSGANYYAAFKIDTTLYALVDVKKKQISDDMRDSLLVPALELLKNNIGETAWEDITKRKTFIETFVNTHYFTDRFNIPALAGPCKKGIYRSFAEFRNNSPFIKDFTIEKSKFNTILLADKNGNYIPTTKLFAFCDGEKYWLLMGNYRFPMLRVGNSFEFFVTFNKRTKLLMAFDMDEGKIY